MPQGKFFLKHSMFSKKVIFQEIKKLNQMYISTVDPEEKEFICKFAVIELCGWIEFCIEDIARSCINRRGCSVAQINFLEEHISRNHSITYSKHFKTLTCLCIGSVDFQTVEKKVEIKIGQRAMAQFQASLSSLKNLRDSIAHCHIAGTARRASAPNTLIQPLNDIFLGLKEFRINIRKHIG